MRVIDNWAEQVAADLRALAGLWHMQGSSALDRAIRGDPAWSFAVVDARRGGQGFIRLLAARVNAPGNRIKIGRYSSGLVTDPEGGAGPALPEVVLSFGVSAAGERTIVARGSDAFTLVATPALDRVAVAPTDHPFAEEIAWRFDIGVDARSKLPEHYNDIPAGFVPSFATWDGEIGLLRVLDAAARMTDGRLQFVPGLRGISDLRDCCGIPETDADISAAYAIDSQTVDPTAYEYRKAQLGGAWSWDDELNRAEGWASEEGRALCQSLIARFRGPAFAKVDDEGR